MAKFKSKKGPEKKGKKSGLTEKLQWLDPFHYVDLFVMPRVKKHTQNRIVEAAVNLVFAAIFAAIIYAVLGVLFGSSTPLVIVYSESMEPGFYRGDVMALTGATDASVYAQEVTLDRSLAEAPLEAFAAPKYEKGVLKALEFENGKEIFVNESGSVIVYPAYPSGLPIIHRVIAKINANDGTYFLTKGDNDLTNPTLDQDCGTILLNNPQKKCITFYAVKTEQIQGKAFLKIPFVGCVKLWLVDDLFSLATTGRLPRDFKGIC